MDPEHYQFVIEGQIQPRDLPSLVARLGPLSLHGLRLSLMVPETAEAPAISSSTLLLDTDGRPLNPDYYDMAEIEPDGTTRPAITRRIFEREAEVSKGIWSGFGKRAYNFIARTAIRQARGDLISSETSGWLPPYAVLSDPPNRLIGLNPQLFGDLVLHHEAELRDIPNIGENSIDLLRQINEGLHR